MPPWAHAGTQGTAGTDEDQDVLPKPPCHGAVWGAVGRQERLDSGSVLPAQGHVPTGLSQPQGFASASLWLQ